MTQWIEEAGGVWRHPENVNVLIEQGHTTRWRRGQPEETFEGFQVVLAGKPMAVYRRLQDAKRAASWWAPFIERSE